MGGSGSMRAFDSEAEAIRLANDSPFGLAAAVMSRDIPRCESVARRFRAGVAWINCSQATFVQAPWGGYKQNGIGGAATTTWKPSRSRATAAKPGAGS
ncbi:aldehyde dehydrogenase family protein [Pseudomonas sp. Fl5BN2]|uniref:aldehyde dehydrogenase family protein n=1 Tax=Pseudomonas sp. Fl5BN2 TaxID=2697652 RepID=UPI0027401D3C|nr:aldehyde dehydrogenase family protein [Pseudomonas sp. Fl5BN2]